MTDQTTENLSGSRAVRFTAAKVIRLAWVKARRASEKETPDADEYELMRDFLNLKLDEVGARARIARSVERVEVDVEAETAAYTLSDTIWDVVDDAHFAYDDSWDLRVRHMGRAEYMAISNKASEGTPTRYYPEKLQAISLKLWPVPDADGTLTIQAVKWLQDVTSTAQTIDLERYWMPYLVCTLAREAAGMGNIDPLYHRTLQMEEDNLLRLALGASKQRGGAQFHMAHRTGWTRRG